MKILFPTEYYPPYVRGGADIYTKFLAERLASEGIDVHILTPIPVKGEDEKVKFHRFWVPRIVYKESPAWGLYRKHRGIYYLFLNKYITLSAWRFSRHIAKLCNKEEYDIVHAQNIESGIGLALSDIEPPKIAHIHDLWFSCLKRGKFADGSCPKCSLRNLQKCMPTNRVMARFLYNETKWRRSMLKGLDHYVAVSDFIAEELEEKVPREKVTTIYPGIFKKGEIISELEKDEAKEALGLEYDFVVLFCGSLVEAKGVGFLPEFAERDPEADFLILGKGPLKDVMSRDPENLHYRREFESELRHYLKASDVLLFPSLWNEPFGRIAVAAHLNKIPVVASRIGGIPEIVEDGRSGILVEPGDVDGFVKGLKKIRDDPSRGKRMGKRGFENAKRKFDSEKIIRQTISMYESVSG